MKQRLNIDVDGSVTKFNSVMKEFKLRQRIFFKGRGLDFEGYRVYSPTDDARDIDWKASARANEILVKEYQIEADKKIMFIVDVGSNMVFGSTPKIKCEYAGEVIAAFSHLLISSNDRVGFFLFDDEIRHFYDCEGGQKRFEMFMDVLSNGENYGGRSNLDLAVSFALDYVDDSISAIILVSDFINVNEDTKKKLDFLSSRFETIAIMVQDPLDISLPDIEGEIALQSPTTGEQLIVNPKIARKIYEKHAKEKKEFVEGVFRKTGIDYVELNTSEDFAIPLAVFLKERLLF